MIPQEFFGVSAGILSAAAFAPYFYSIFNGRTQPHLYSWIIWSLIQGTGGWIMFAEGAHWGATGLTVGTVLCVGVSILSLRYGTRDIKWIDTLCLIGALSAFAIYAVVNEPYISLALVIFIDLVGFIPTFRKTIRDPGSEITTTWMLFAVSNVFTLAALEVFTVLTAAYPILLLICESALTTTLLTLRWRK